jgi:hypothetical protein
MKKSIVIGAALLVAAASLNGQVFDLRLPSVNNVLVLSHPEDSFELGDSAWVNPPSF